MFRLTCKPDVHASALLEGLKFLIGHSQMQDCCIILANLPQSPRLKHICRIAAGFQVVVVWRAACQTDLAEGPPGNAVDEKACARLYALFTDVPLASPGPWPTVKAGPAEALSFGQAFMQEHLLISAYSPY